MYLPYTYNPTQQREVIVPFLGFLRREFPAHGPDLFVYRSAVHGTFTVAGWANRGRMRVVDLCILGSEPMLTRAHVQALRDLLCPTPAATLSSGALGRAIRESDYRDTLALRDRAEEMRRLER